MEHSEVFKCLGGLGLVRLGWVWVGFVGLCGSVQGVCWVVCVCICVCVFVCVCLCV